MSWTKKQLIDAAFTEIGLQNYAYDMEPEDSQSAITTMDAMIAGWNLNLGYIMSGSPSTSNPNSASGLPIWANEGVYLNLAVAICSRYGKIASRELVVNAKKALSAVQTKCATIPVNQWDKRLPVGQGNKPFIGVAPEFFKPVDELTDDNGANLV